MHDPSTVVDYVEASWGNDFVLGGEAANALMGGANKDTLVGGSGDDYIAGDGFNYGGAAGDLFHFDRDIDGKYTSYVTRPDGAAASLITRG